MNDSTFDAAKNYKKVCYRPDRDLLNTELNEAQDMESHERRELFDKVFSQGTIISGLDAVVNGNDVTIAAGVIYVDGCAVNVPGATLSFADAGEHTIYLDVFRRVVTASEDPSLVNVLTGEPTAEREKWIATLQTRDTTGDPLPEGALSRSVTPVYLFNRDTGEIQPVTGSSEGDIWSALANHAGHGGLDRHPAATTEIAGFMTPEQVTSLESVEATLPDKADNTDVTAVSDALAAHKTSSDHDARYYTETEADGRFAPISHVGSNGNAHAEATTDEGGFMSAQDKTQIGEHEARIVAVEDALPGKAEDADVTAVSNALNTHKTSADHDSRYYTETESDNRFAPKAHVGSGGTAHSVATTAQAGFMSAADKVELGNHESRLVVVEAALPGKADDADVLALQNSLNSHKTSSDHDSRYYTETESDGRFAPANHVGSGGGTHSLATSALPGFMPREVAEVVSGLIYWNCDYDYGNDNMAVLPYKVMSGPSGMIWRGRCDSNSRHTLAAVLRAVGSPITATFELFHMTGTVTMQGSRVTLADPAYHPSTVPGSKIYYVQLYPDSFTSFYIRVTGSGEVGFSLSIFPGDDRQICYDVDPNRAGKLTY